MAVLARLAYQNRVLNPGMTQLSISPNGISDIQPFLLFSERHLWIATDCNTPRQNLDAPSLRF